jgi:hypothetical protein
MMAFVLSICSHHDIVRDRCRGPWKKSDVRPAELLTNTNFLPLKIAKEGDFSPTKTPLTARGRCAFHQGDIDG